MKTLKIAAKNGTETPITLLTNWDMLFCIPVFILSCLNYFIVRPLIRIILGIISLPYFLIMGTKEKQSKGRFVLSILLNIVALPVLYYVDMFFPAMDQTYQIIVALAYVSLGVGVANILIYIQVPANGPIHEFIDAQAEHIPEYLVDTKLSDRTKVIHYIITVMAVYQLVFMFIFGADSWLYWMTAAPLLYLLLFMDKEAIEHFASHTVDGRLVKYKEAKTLFDWTIIAIEYTRIYVIWPLVFWMPDYYYCSHTGIHHMENNGPRDFQSTLRFDHTSFLEFTRAVTWFSLFTQVLPVDIVRYFKSQKRDRLLKLFLRGYLMGGIALVALTWMFPIIGLTLIISTCLSGVGTYVFVMSWHGFHDATQAYSIDASNSSPLHWGHHKKMNINLTEQNVLARLFWVQNDKNPGMSPIYRNSQALDMFNNNWLLFCSHLWQDKLGVINKFIHTDAKTNAELRKFVAGAGLIKQGPKMKAFDRKISHAIGRVVESLTRRGMTPEEQAIFDLDAEPANVNIRSTNFAKTDPKTNTYVGLY